MTRMTTRVLAGVGGLLATVALALAPSVAASAHDYLVDTSPASGATQTEPLTQVKLTFNDRVLDLGGNGSSAILRVTDASGKHYETGCPTILDTAVSAPVALGVAGGYTVDWQVVSADGHTVSGSYGFTYQPPAGTAAAPGSAASRCARSNAVATPGAAAPAPTSTVSTAVPTKASSGNDLGLVIGIAIGIVALAVIGVVILLLTRRRPQPTEDSPPDTPDTPANRS
ncbi:copper resistance protein CopC [Leifsonia sp. NPDC056665]|uniref:copper resistance CopC family protein n=1 Tax=Leifsonia sp. NPDC056665 TaxID=3345901 RepID=UPI003676B2B1